ncbi:MAG TPA: VOC family protein [Actinopolymorphaceae bacterium]|jgi:lactoylglutathione lyase
MFTSLMPHLYAADVDRTVAFYRDLLGFIESFRYPSDGPAEHVEVRVGDVVLGISAQDAVRAIEGLPEPTPGHPMELTVWCDSVDEAVARLRDAGVPVLVEPYDHPARHRRAYVTDPDGNWVALVGK